jgi:RNA polymerase sigma factor (sigma-70 family)
MNDEGEHAAKQKREEFDNQWLTHYKKLYPYVLNLTRNKADAEDITQDALMSFKEYMEKNQWNVEFEDEDAYRRRIAHNLYVDLCKRRKREGLVSCDDEEDERTRKEAERKASAHDSEIARIEEEMHYKKLLSLVPLKAMLNGLSDYELQLLRLKKLEEKTTEEVAEDLKTNVYQVRYDINKLDAKLRYRAKKLLPPGNGRLL